MRKNRHQKISDTEFRVFSHRDEAVRSQEHAIGGLEKKIALYSQIFNDFGAYKSQKQEEKLSYLTAIVDGCREEFSRSQSYHGELVYRYLVGSKEGNPT